MADLGKPLKVHQIEPDELPIPSIIEIEETSAPEEVTVETPELVPA